MRGAGGQETARSDVPLLVGCTALALLALALPRNWALTVATGLRQTAFRPVVALQARAAQDRRSRFDLARVQRVQDSLAILVQQQDALRRENDNLRGLVGVRARLSHPSVPAEVLHQPTVTDTRMLLLDVGTNAGVRMFDAVVTAEGLIGAVVSIGATSSSAITWANPDFSASAVTADGRVAGFVRPLTLSGTGGPILELHGIALRDSLPPGTVVMTAGAGGTYPRGIPIGRVVSAGRDENGYDRIYRVVPFASPGGASHVVILITPRDSVYPRAPAPVTTPVRVFRPGDRRRRGRAGDRLRVAFVLAVLLLLEFYLRPSIVEGQHGTPDFLILVLLLLAIRETPGVAALTGFLIGLVVDVLTPAHFGAGILANVLVGWGAAWGRSLFFADNILVNGALFFLGTWVRDVLMLLLSGTPIRALPAEVLLWAPLQGLSTALVGIVVVVIFRDWLAIRIET